MRNFQALHRPHSTNDSEDDPFQNWLPSSASHFAPAPSVDAPEAPPVDWDAGPSGEGKTTTSGGGGTKGGRGTGSGTTTTGDTSGGTTTGGTTTGGTTTGGTTTGGTTTGGTTTGGATSTNLAAPHWTLAPPTGDSTLPTDTYFTQQWALNS